MRWQDLWAELFDEPPVDRTSREVSVQEVLAVLIAGRRCDWFVPYLPTARGAAFLSELWRAAFGDAGRIEWFVSEYARHRLPDAATDFALLAPHRPGANPSHDGGQRYAELTWDVIPPLLADVFPRHRLAEALGAFLAADLAATERAPAPTPRAALEIAPGERVDDLVASAVLHAMRLAPSVAKARPGDRTERGLDVVFATTEEARAAQAAVKQALASSGYGERVTVWLWQPSSTGYPTTSAGHAVGRELRLAPTRGN